MNEDRRQSMRLSTRLPCAWQPVDEPLDYSALRTLFALPQAVEAQFALEDASGAVHDTLRDLSDSRVRMALHALDHKLDIVAGMVGSADAPEPQDLTLSLHGMDLDCEEWLDPGRIVACHLLLDGSYHYLSMGTVSRCSERDVPGTWRLGVVFAMAHTSAALACEAATVALLDGAHGTLASSARIVSVDAMRASPAR